MLKQIYRFPEVMKLTGLSRSSIYLVVSKEEFPKPIKIGRRAVGWHQNVIEEWIQKLMERNNERGRFTKQKTKSLFLFSKE